MPGKIAVEADVERVALVVINGSKAGRDIESAVGGDGLGTIRPPVMGEVASSWVAKPQRSFHIVAGGHSKQTAITAILEFSSGIIAVALFLRFARHAVVTSLDQIHLRLSCPPFTCVKSKNKYEGFAALDVCLSVRKRPLQKETKSNDNIFGTAPVFCATAKTSGSSIHQPHPHPGMCDSASSRRPRCHRDRRHRHWQDLGVSPSRH